MKISIDKDNGHCLLEGDHIGFQIALKGLSAAELNRLLHGNGPASSWRPDGSNRKISADNAVAPAKATGSAVVHKLEDGDFESTSGGPGQLIVDQHHNEPISLLPQSLHLLLTQQWARSGIHSLHAAAILTPAGGILVIGPRGGGKSVLSLSALVAGHGVISDDWILLGPGSDDQIQVERLRPFMMLRQSWAADQLRARLPNLIAAPVSKRPKQVIRLPVDSPQFPIGGTIDQIWLLKRPRSARRSQTSIDPIPSASALAKLVEASMPVLFSRQFPIEHQALMETSKLMLAKTRAMQVETGMDLVESPHAAWRRLLNDARQECDKLAFSNEKPDS